MTTEPGSGGPGRSLPQLWLAGTSGMLRWLAGGISQRGFPGGQGKRIHLPTKIIAQSRSGRSSLRRPGNPPSTSPEESHGQRAWQGHTVRGVDRVGQLSTYEHAVTENPIITGSQAVNNEEVQQLSLPLTRGRHEIPAPRRQNTKRSEAVQETSAFTRGPAPPTLELPSSRD